MMSDWYGFGGWEMGLGFIFMLLFWGLVIPGIAALIRWLIMQSSPSHSSKEVPLFN